VIDAGALADRIARLRDAYRDCRICPRDCGADRLAGAAGAYCGLDARALVYKELIHHGEEEVFGPTWLLDLGGCSLRCLFCTEWTHVTKPRSKPAGLLDPAWFAARNRARRAQGARSVSFAGGDPTVSLLGVLRALAAVPAAERLPLVWNCNGWLSRQARAALDGLVACWLIDKKFGAAGCGRRLAATADVDYAREVDVTLDFATASGTGEGKLPKVLIRHLLMPGHLRCCALPVIDEVATQWPDATFNLMTGYLPFGPALGELPGAPELGGMNADADVAIAIRHAHERIANLLIDGRSPPQ